MAANCQSAELLFIDMRYYSGMLALKLRYGLELEMRRNGISLRIQT